MEATTEQAERLLFEILWHGAPERCDTVEDFDRLPYRIKKEVLNDWLNTKSVIKGKGLVSHYNWLKFLDLEAEAESENPLVTGITLNGEPVYRNDW